ncbi:VanW family protein [Nocardioides sp. R-C-SC26]|uniref:VanW family protein n=1 Tax=Nocardioides sp. R-C-SC26 TaxID=2870414 RepID=UPI001E4F8B88|nr:VanW family protein [Nocardioides sp. R-C-SC26]
MSKPKKERAGGVVVLVVVLVLAVLVGGGWAAAYAGAGDKLPRGASIAGVDVGGLTPAGAENTLRDGLAERIERPLEVTVDGSTESFDPALAGLAIDYAASVEAAGGGRSWSPARLWEYYTGGDDMDAVVEIDEEEMEAALSALEGSLGTPAKDGGIRFVDGSVETTSPVTGRGFDRDAAQDALVRAFLAEDAEPVELDVVELEPDVTEAEVQEALRSFANPAMSSSVRLRFGSAYVRLQPDQFSEALAMKAEDGALVPHVRIKRLTRLVESATSGDGAPVDATVEVVGGTPRVVKAKPGISFEPDDVAAAFLEVVVKPEGEREATVEGEVTQPEFTTRDARNLKIVEEVSEFTTNFPYAEYRNTNIGRAAEIIDGTLLKPGETFSLNDIVGERTRENGFTEGFIISNGIFKEDLGGGVSQVATTVFNAMFFAGLEDVEHKPHSFYIDRYPVGREATVAWGSVDLRFRNDTDYGVLIDTELRRSTPSSQGALTVRMYSTKVWDIESITGNRYAFTSPATRTLDTPDCYANSGYGGFSIDVTRVFRRVGESEIARREVFKTVYTPSDTVICRPPGSLDR